MSDITVSFPAPCAESWEAMAPAGCHRHCASCDKVIHDLSVMTLAEAEQLLQEPGGACVRARIGPDGVIALADSGGRHKRRLLAAVSVSMTLAAAACQTPLAGPVSPRFTISGETYSWYHSQKVRLTTANGEEISPALSKDHRFRFTNLKPGTYIPQYTDLCGETHVGNPVTVSNTDVDVGRFEWENECIIVGVMAPVDDWRG